MSAARVWLAAVVAACSSPAPPPHAADAACDASQLPLLVSTSGGVPDRLHVPVTYAGSAAVLLVDTGSPTTFLQEPLGSRDPTLDAGTVTLGCSRRAIGGRPEAAGMPLGALPEVGTLGADQLLAGPSELDLVGAQLLVHPHGQPIADAAAWPAAPFDVVSGLVLVHATLGGAPVRLMLDTGSPDMLWLGQQPQPGDVEEDTTDALGNPVKLYRGSAELALGAWSGSVPVLRAPSFPYLEQTVADLGGNIAGLLGLSALASRDVVDGDAALLRVDRD